MTQPKKEEEKEEREGVSVTRCTIAVLGGLVVVQHLRPVSEREREREIGSVSLTHSFTELQGK